MEAKSQPEKENQIPVNEVIINSNFLALYVDLVVRGLIAFIILGLIVYYILMQIFHLPIWIALPIVFLLSIFSSPLLSKIRLGHIVQSKYDNFLRHVIIWTRR